MISKYLKDFLENEKKEQDVLIRDEKLNNLLKYKDCIQYSIFGYDFYIKDNVNSKLNDLIQNTSGKTQAFLILYYMAFEDELSSNIHMFHSIIGENNIKTKEQLLKFLNNNELYNVAIKMKNIDIFKYWREIIKEGYGNLLIDELEIDDIKKFLEETSNFIINSGNKYIHKMSRTFI